jgi:hypothetical protein
MHVSRPFGLTLCRDSAREIALAAIRQPPDTGVASVVTVNIDHIATFRRFPPLARAYSNVAPAIVHQWPSAGRLGVHFNFNLACLFGMLRRTSTRLVMHPTHANLAGLKP